MGFWRNAIITFCLMALSGAAAAQQRHKATPEQLRAAEEELARFNSPTLTRFADESEFRRYLGAVLAAERARHGWWAHVPRIQFASLQAQTVQSDAIEPICPDT